ncbi:expressed unknown protein [Seminavis robusta]|uniref:Uncharacterized protein n=1 Tax=Seminavis robusta TaxID=568900 RepID=A0A9N8EUC3_9STRA|nr:expressed unknown protein [Seminavis robusta]|eukprot:Sro1597_g284890.1 n/a (996) ;mRNA; r:14582-17757
MGTTTTGNSGGDSDLTRTSRRSKAIQSRWNASFFLMAVAVFLLFKAGEAGQGAVEEPVLAETQSTEPVIMDLLPSMNKKQLSQEEEEAMELQQMVEDVEEYEAALAAEAAKEQAAKEQAAKEQTTNQDKEQTEQVRNNKKQEEWQEARPKARRAAEDKKDDKKEEEKEEFKLPEQIPTIPAASQSDKIKAFKQKTRPKVPYQYQRRAVIDQDPSKKNDRNRIRKELGQKWGTWRLQDPKFKDRPQEDFAKQFPSRDIPWNKFPPSAWQVDQEYLKKFLPEAKALVERSMEAILAEYGWSKFDLPDQTLEERYMGKDEEPHSFRTPIINVTDIRDLRLGNDYGGWISEKYYRGLIRRIMHAIITGDTFTMVMGGHSASAGHGNHFQQSYTLQFFKVLEPVFARLGVKLNTHNVGFGGLGTLQSSMGSKDLYGQEIDMLIWDSQMTEKSNEAYDFFARQAIMAGKRVPVFLNGMPKVLGSLDKAQAAEVGMLGEGKGGVPEIVNAKMAESVPHAARYLRCNGETRGLCREKEYNGTCWIDRDDYTPRTNQQAEPGGRASWHPGFRQHAVRGRLIAFPVLRALLEGLTLWDEATDKKLPVEVWHVDEHYKTLKKNLEEMPESESPCFTWKDVDPKAILCNKVMSAASEMTPRVFPKDTHLRHLIKPALDGSKPEPPGYEYSPPDVFNPTMETPDGEFDYLAVVENGVDYPEFMAFDNSPLPPFALPTGNKVIPLGTKTELKQGKGWGVRAPGNADGCDGSYDGFCNRGQFNPCLLYGHNDNRGGLSFTSFSGWGIFTIPNVKEGLILIRLEWWGYGKEHPETRDWDKENDGDEAYARRLSEEDDLEDDADDASYRYPNDAAYPNETSFAPYLDDGYYVDEVDETFYLDEADTRPFAHWNTTEPERARRLGEPPRQRRLKGNENCNEIKFEVIVNGKKTEYNKAKFHERLKIFQRVVQVIEVLNDPNLTNGVSHDIEIAMRITGCGHTNMWVLSGIYWA